jgi:hypothetical protein
MRRRTASRVSAGQGTWWLYFFETGQGRKENLSPSVLGIRTGTIVTNQGDEKNTGVTRRALLPI